MYKSFSIASLIRSFVLLAACSLLITLNACATRDDKDAEKTERSLYQSAQKALNSSQYDYAVELFRKIELRFPFGRYAEQAQLESIYAYYQNDEYASASVAADRFIRQHPEHPNLDYAYYVKGLSNYHVDSTLTDRLLTNSSARRDLTSAKSAFYIFQELIETFPQSDYLADAQKRMLYLRDLIARQEIEVAYYYMQRAAYVAAINRGKAVVEDYPGSTASGDALAIQVQAYQEMGMNDLAEDALKVLVHNFPDYEKLNPDGSLAPYDKLYYDEVNWINFISFGYLNKNAGKNAVKVENDKAPAKIEEADMPRPLPQASESTE